MCPTISFLGGIFFYELFDPFLELSLTSKRSAPAPHVNFMHVGEGGFSTSVRLRGPGSSTESGRAFTSC